jgi:hypothetical protein
MKPRNILIISAIMLLALLFYSINGGKIDSLSERAIIYSNEKYSIYYDRPLFNSIKLIDLSPVDVWLMSKDGRVKVLISQLDMPLDLNENIFKNLNLSYELRNDGGVKLLTYKNDDLTISAQQGDAPEPASPAR